MRNSFRFLESDKASGCWSIVILISFYAKIRVEVGVLKGQNQVVTASQTSQ